MMIPSQSRVEQRAKVNCERESRERPRERGYDRKGELSGGVGLGVGV